MCFGRIPLEEKRIFAGRKVWKPKGQKGFSYGRKKERKCAGGKGVISVLSNIYPSQTELLAQLALKGDLPRAQELAYALEPVIRYLFIDVNPIMPKAALARMGICKPTLRLPLIEPTEENKKLLFDAMDKFEKLGF